MVASFWAVGSRHTRSPGPEGAFHDAQYDASEHVHNSACYEIMCGVAEYSAEVPCLCNICTNVASLADCRVYVTTGGLRDAFACTSHLLAWSYHEASLTQASLNAYPLTCKDSLGWKKAWENFESAQALWAAAAEADDLRGRLARSQRAADDAALLDDEDANAWDALVRG